MGEAGPWQGGEAGAEAVVVVAVDGRAGSCCRCWETGLAIAPGAGAAPVCLGCCTHCGTVALLSSTGPLQPSPKGSKGQAARRWRQVGGGGRSPSHAGAVGRRQAHVFGLHMYALCVCVCVSLCGVVSGCVRVAGVHWRRHEKKAITEEAYCKREAR